MMSADDEDPSVGAWPSGAARLAPSERRGTAHNGIVHAVYGVVAWFAGGAAPPGVPCGRSIPAAAAAIAPVPRPAAPPPAFRWPLRRHAPETAS